MSFRGDNYATCLDRCMFETDETDLKREVLLSNFYIIEADQITEYATKTCVTYHDP